MKILLIHNRYIFRGGEDEVFKNEKELLEIKGHEVILYEKNNSVINSYNIGQKLQLLWQTASSKKSYKELYEFIKKAGPDICHVHNFFPLISPIVFEVCHNLKVPIVATLHNYRLICANAYLFRNDGICEKCVGRNAFQSVKYACYRSSRVQSMAVAYMIEKNKRNNLWFNKCDAYICLTHFAKKIFMKSGFPEDLLHVKPNFIKNEFEVKKEVGKTYLYIGRLDKTKGIDLLLKACQELPNQKFVVVGDGPLKDMVKMYPGSNIEYLGQVTRNKIKELLYDASALLFPSIWYEGLPMTIIEALASGTPVIASRLGAMGEILENKNNGLLFEPGNLKEFIDTIKWADEHQSALKEMGMNARVSYERYYTGEENYDSLINIYKHAINRKMNIRAL